MILRGEKNKAPDFSKASRISPYKSSFAGLPFATYVMETFGVGSGGPHANETIEANACNKRYSLTHIFRV
jgi:hypothetical protein